MPAEDDIFATTKSSDSLAHKTCDIVDHKTVKFGNKLEVVQDDTYKRNRISVIAFIAIACVIYNYILYF